MKIADTATRFNRWKGAATWLLLALVALVLVWHSLYWYREVNDDSYISFRYARNLAEGKGLTYNAGERVEGFSNFLWVMILAAAIRLGVTDLVLLSKVLGPLFAAAALVLAALLFRRLYPRAGAAWAALPALLMAASPITASWSTWGLETPLFTLLLTAAILLYARGVHHSPGGLALVAAVFLAASLTRPEGIVFLAVPLLGTSLRAAGDRERLKRDGLLVLVTLALFAVYFGWRMAYFGELWPNTYFAKTTYGAPLFSKPRGWRYISAFFLKHNPPLTAMAVIGLAAAARAGRLPLVLVTPIVAKLAYIWYVNGDWMANFRFFMPLLPFLLVLSTGPLLELARERGGARARALKALLLALAAWSCFSGLRVAEDSRYSKVDADLKPKSAGLWLSAPWKIPRLGFEPLLWEQYRWMVERMDPGELAAVPDIGFIGWASEFELYDTQGLVDAGLSHLFHMRRKGRSIEAELEEEFLRKRPAYVFLRRNQRTGAGVNLLERVLLASPAFNAEWAPAEEFPFRESLGMYLWLRRDARVTPSPETVLERYRLAIGWNPRMPHLWVALQNYYLLLGDEAAARRVAEEGRERFPYAVSFIRAPGGEP